MTRNIRSLIGPCGWFVSALSVFVIYYLLSGSRVSVDPDSVARDYLLTGDEPHYLLLAHSIAFDGDIDLKNNRLNRDYLAYTEDKVSGYVKTKSFWIKYVKGALRDKPDAYWSERFYSVCPPGMPFLIAPAYRIGHEWGGRVRFCVSIFLMMLVTAMVLMASDLVLRKTGSVFMTFCCGLCAALSGPLLFYTVHIYPDVPGAFLVLLAVWLFYRLEPAEKHMELLLLPLLGTVAGLLPWMHARFWPLTVIIGIFSLVHIYKKQVSWNSKLVFLGIPFLAVIIPLLAYYMKLYGVPYPVSTHPPISLKVGFKTGWIGLWLDRNNGLLWYSPAAVFSIAGLWMMLKNDSLADRMVSALILTNWLLIGTFSDWRGGLCSPLRYWMPVFSLLVIPGAICLSRVRNVYASLLAGTTGAAGIVIGVAAMLHPGRLFKYAHPVLPYWEWTRFYKIAPKFFPEAQSGDVWRGLAMLVLVIGMSVVLINLAYRKQSAENKSSIDL